METVDHYAVLGVNKTVSFGGIRTAYLKLAKKYHPDLHNGSKQYEEKFKNITMAYQVLSDPIKRKKYDESCISGKNNNAKREDKTQQSTQSTHRNYYSRGFYNQSAEQRAKYYESGTNSHGFKYDYQRYDYQSAEERAKKYEYDGGNASGPDTFHSGAAKQSDASNTKKTNSKNSTTRKRRTDTASDFRNVKKKNNKSGQNRDKQPLENKAVIDLLFAGMSRDLDDVLVSADKFVLALHKELTNLRKNTRGWTNFLELMAKSLGR